MQTILSQLLPILNDSSSQGFEASGHADMFFDGECDGLVISMQLVE